MTHVLWASIRGRRFPMDGGSRVAEVLKSNGVKSLFTLCGGHISPILVEAKRRGIRIIDTRHEVNAVFAADATSRLTGVPGVAAVTAGPGVTNSITAIKNAQLAQSPLVLLGGATATMLRGRGSLQDIDQMALIQPHVKWAARPNTLREVVPSLERAFQEAKRGVPGPVFVEIAVDLLYPEKLVRDWYKAKTEKPDMNLVEKATSLYIKGHLKYVFTELEGPVIHSPSSPPAPDPTNGEIRTAVRMLKDAERPSMVLGSQAMLHPDRIGELITAIEKIGAPVYLSGMARGLLPTSHPLVHRHKRREALRESDLVILCGVPCDFRLDYGAHVARAKVIGVNLSADDLNKNRKPELGVEADPLRFLSAVARLLDAPPSRKSWFEKLHGRDREREAEIAKMAEEPGPQINPIALCKAIDARLGDKSILIGDGGDFVATASYTLSPKKPLSWLDPGVFGTLGVGAGFAMAAQAARPDADVWILYGDGAAGFSAMEFDTFVRHKLPVIAIVGNDAGWTQILRDQEPILGDSVGCTLTHMDYHRVAEGCGAKGIRVESPAEMNAALDEAVRLSRQGHPVLVNAIIGRSDFRKGSISM
jgi:acetolactate synthase-like protein